jgi:LysR family transcriptional activator of nhaA
VRLVCREGKLENLLADLALHRLDCVLSIRPVPPGLSLRTWNHNLGGSPIGLFAPRALKLSAKAYPQCLHGQPLLLPGDESPIRAQLMDWFEAQRLVPRVVAEFDDTALMKTFGRAGAGVFPAPVAIADEISQVYDSLLLGPAGNIEESYYAISTERRVSHPSVRAIIDAASKALHIA